jgi:formate dehydrogenase subunit gamma
MTTLIDTTSADRLARDICHQRGNLPDQLIEILHDVQAEAGFISAGAITTIAHQLNLSRAEVVGVVSFYHDFRQSPAHGVDLRICLGEACQATGASDLFEWARETLAGACNVQRVYCLGNCALGPAGLVAGVLVGRLTPESLGRAHIAADVGDA